MLKSMACSSVEPIRPLEPMIMIEDDRITSITAAIAPTQSGVGGFDLRLDVEVRVKMRQTKQSRPRPTSSYSATSRAVSSLPSHATCASAESGRERSF